MGGYNGENAQGISQSAQTILDGDHSKTYCENCCKSDVCMKKHDFIKFKMTLNQARNRIEEDSEMTMDFVTYEVKCKHYMHRYSYPITQPFYEPSHGSGAIGIRNMPDITCVGSGHSISTLEMKPSH